MVGTGSKEISENGSSQVEDRFLMGTKDPNELLDSLNDYAKELIANSGKDGKEVIPHLVLAHGFFAWQRFLTRDFSSFDWQFEKELPTSFDEEGKFEKFIYDRFFQGLSERSTFDGLTKDEKVELREKGWQAYLED